MALAAASDMAAPVVTSSTEAADCAGTAGRLVAVFARPPPPRHVRCEGQRGYCLQALMQALARLALAEFLTYPWWQW